MYTIKQMGLSIRKIAEALDRLPSTISRELRRKGKFKRPAETRGRFNIGKTIKKRPKEVQESLELLNNRPRKYINYKTPNEYFNQCLLECCT